jgi:hypothetical protein
MERPSGAGSGAGDSGRAGILFVNEGPEPGTL